MGESTRVLWAAGLSDESIGLLESALGAEFRRGLPEQLTSEDCVLLGSELGRADGAAFVQPFSACVALKRRGHGSVFLVAGPDETDANEIARYCLADGVLTRSGEGFEGLDRLQKSAGPASRAPSRVDALLEKLEADLASDDSGRADIARRIVERSEDSGILEHLTDPETGLFNGPFAGFKLDEEIKRANRFHQPLSVVLLDVGLEAWPEDSSSRMLLMGELAAVFLEGCRDIDVLARFSESVFLFLLPGTGSAGAEAVANRLAAELSERRFDGSVSIDPAFGVVTVPQPGIKDRRKLLALAENCLATARSGSGSDRVTVDTP
ncbi:MAG: hypothetical protein AAF196_16685 [Planctomycetota bacterium]